MLAPPPEITLEQALAEKQDIERLTAEDVLTEDAKNLLKGRLSLWLQCEVEPAARAAVLRLCKYGTPDTPGYLFFFRTFATIFEPRNPAGLRKLPFVPYDYQEEELHVIHEAVTKGEGVLGKKSTILWLKSRDMGMTWIVLMYFLWDFLFNGGSYHVGSFKENEVDKLGTMNTLFGKLRFAISLLPEWIKPTDLVSNYLIISCNGGESSITGESANAGFGRSKRVKATLMDEYQKWEVDRPAFTSVTGGTCNVVFLVGTPNGYGNHYSEIANKKTLKNAMVRRVHWTAHPLKARGMAVVDGKYTSEWYRQACAELDGEPQIIAAELDLSFDSSVKGPIYADSYGPLHQKKNLIPIAGVPILRCWDPGGWSAVIFMQFDRYGRIRVYREVVTEGLKLEDVRMMVLETSEELARSALPSHDKWNWVDHFRFEDCGDPSGASTSKSNQLVPEYEELADNDIFVDYLFMATMPTELRVRARHIAVQNKMTKFINGSEEIAGPAFWVDIDECPILDEALRGGYRRKTNPIDGKVLGDTVETRHPYNDVCDALGYGVLYKCGVPEKIRTETSRKSEERLEDERSTESGDYYGHARRTRC